MPVVIAREGTVEPVVTGIPPERRQAAWARIVQAWAEKHPELLQDPQGEAKQGDAK